MHYLHPGRFFTNLLQATQIQTPLYWRSLYLFYTSQSLRGSCSAGARSNLLCKKSNFYVYMMTNPFRTVLYTGITNDISRRVQEHQEKIVESFTKRYNCVKLVFVEVHEDAYSAISREKQIKAGSRNKKIALIMKENPSWRDLSDTL